MQIPVGLMSPNARMDRRIGGSPDQGYWQGDRFIFPKYKRPPMAPPMVPSGPTVDAMTPPMAMPAPQLPPIIGGDGPQGEFGGREDTSEPGHNVDVQGVMNAGTPAVSAVPAGLPSLPDFNPATAVAPAVAQAAPSKGMSETQATNQAAAQAAAQAAGLGRATVDKAVEEKGLIDAMKDVMAAAPVGMTGVVSDIDVKSPSEANATATKGTVDDPDYAPEMGGTAGVGGGLGADGIGGPGAGGIGSPSADGSSTGGANQGGNTGSAAPGGPGDPGPGGWRAGGRTGNDGDKKKMEPRGKAHEDEFYFNPEMTGLMDRVAPGLLDRLDRFQKGLMAPRNRGRGLMG